MANARLSHAALFLCVTLAPILVTSCGGGGGSGSAGQHIGISPPPPPVSPPPPPPPSGSGWQQGVFSSASAFLNRCEIARTGVDAEGARFPDIQGSLLDEKNWLRSWTSETYLWNNEVVDRDPAATPSKLDYFALLRTLVKTASGKDKDDFHFSEPTAETLARRTSAATATYGASFAILASSRPRDIRVRFTEPNSPASEVIGGSVQLPRGAKILSVNGIDAINGATTSSEVDQLNAALFPAVSGLTTTFVIREAGATADRTVSITSTTLASKPVNRTAVLATPTGKVGYILFNTFSPFSSEREIRDAITSLQSEAVTDLVLDLRYNGGGLLTVASQLSYMIAGPSRTNGRVFESLRFNASSGGRNPVTGAANTPTGFQSTGVGFSVPNGTALPNLNLRRVYVLSTARTCSASEAVINGLRGIDVEVVLIGATTCGKPYGFYATDNCGQTYYTIQFQGVNNVGFGDYADGFIPQNSTAQFGVRIGGCSVSDDFSKELGDPSEAMLAAALSYRATGSCPALSSALAPAPASAAANGQAGAKTSDTPQLIDPLAVREPRPSVFETNRDMTTSRDGGYR
jgi:carboxyl-terminal processing protease